MLNDDKKEFNDYQFIDVSANAEIPSICKEEQLSSIHWSLKRIGLLLLKTTFDTKSRSKKKGKKGKQKRCTRNHQISNKDMIGIKRNMYPTICGYLLNYPFIYFTSDASSHCLNQHKLRLFTIHYNATTVVQFSVPQNIVDAIDNETMMGYCARLCHGHSKQMKISSTLLTSFVTL